MPSATVLLLLAPCARPALAQQPPWPSGQVVERVVSRADSTQSYAVYLPVEWTAARRWPVLFVMDPLGRALLPLECFRPAAERHGWVLFSSWDARSDTLAEVTERALDAMVQDAQTLAAVDTRRFYLAGLSGTARLAWSFGYALPDVIAGVIGVGAGLPDPRLLLPQAGGEPAPFDFYGAVGRRDFNFAEVRELDARLDATSVTHHVQMFDGAHDWPTEPVCGDAVHWLAVRALADPASADTAARAWADSVWNVHVADASAREASDAPGALVAWHWLASAYAGVRDTSAAGAAVRRLAARREVRARERRLDEDVREDARFRERLETALVALRAAPSASAARRTADALRLAELRRVAAGSDTLRADAAGRRLATATMRAGRYEASAALARGDTLAALALYELAHAAASRPRVVCDLHERLRRAWSGGAQVAPPEGCATPTP